MHPYITLTIKYYPDYKTMLKVHLTTEQSQQSQPVHTKDLRRDFESHLLLISLSSVPVSSDWSLLLLLPRDLLLHYQKVSPNTAWRTILTEGDHTAACRGSRNSTSAVTLWQNKHHEHTKRPTSTVMKQLAAIPVSSDVSIRTSVARWEM